MCYPMCYPIPGDTGIQEAGCGESGPVPGGAWALGKLGRLSRGILGPGPKGDLQ